jgi:hypothetical protein
MTKLRLTQQEHTELGHTLAGVRDELLRRHVQLCNAYPRSGEEGRPATLLGRALDALDAARTELDHAVFREHPRTAQTTDYYPAEEDRSAVGPRRP